MHRLTRLLLIALAALAVFSLVACGGGITNEQRKTSVKHRAKVFDRARAAAPEPSPVNFPLRKALVEFTERQDLESHPWYTYILGENGNAVGYFVGKTVPINACNFLSSTEDIWSDDKSSQVVTAPSLDGIFYGGGGAAAGCDSWFFFDATTDALVQIRGVGFFTADEPLRIDAKPIKVAPGK